jgi:hypothetical protein
MKGIVPLGVAAAAASLGVVSLFGVLQANETSDGIDWQSAESHTVSTSESGEMALADLGAFGGLDLVQTFFNQFDLNM